MNKLKIEIELDWNIHYRFNCYQYLQTLEYQNFSTVFIIAMVKIFFINFHSRRAYKKPKF